MGSSLEQAYDITNLKLDLDELQGSPEFIAKRKAREAANHCDEAVIVEDVCLCFNGLKGLPGPYIKDFLTKLGNDGLVAMLQGFPDKSAYAQCIYAFCEGKGHEPVLFAAKQNGTIVPPRGDNAFGWDPIFKPEGRETTYAEMSPADKNKVSPRAYALRMVKKFLQERASKVIK